MDDRLDLSGLPDTLNWWLMMAPLTQDWLHFDRVNSDWLHLDGMAGQLHPFWLASISSLTNLLLLLAFIGLLLV